MTTAARRRTALVAGAIANKAGNGGEAWVRISWVRALESLGFEVLFVEQLADVSDPAWRHVAAEWFRDVTSWAGWSGRAWLVDHPSAATSGPNPALIGNWSDLLVGLGRCELLVDISGNLTGFEPAASIATRVHVDLDPGYTQVWAEEGHLDLSWHHVHATVGTLIGEAGCVYPTNHRTWIPVRQPVLLEDWPVHPCPPHAMFSTVTSWRGGFGPLTWDGRTSGVKAHRFRELSPVIAELSRPARLVADIDEADHADLATLHASGWVVDSPSVTAGPEQFASFVRGSAGELSIAHPAYVDGHTGWFSDRTVRYLASGRPAVVEDTGWTESLPNGSGLLAFDTPEEAAEGVERVCADYERHSVAARQLAAEWFSPAAALAPLLTAIG